MSGRTNKYIFMSCETPRGRRRTIKYWLSQFEIATLTILGCPLCGGFHKIAQEGIKSAPRRRRET